MIQRGYCEEKLDASQSKSSRVKSCCLGKRKFLKTPNTSNLLKKKLCILSKNLLAFMICETFLPSFSSQEWAGQVEISALSLMYK